MITYNTKEMERILRDAIKDDPNAQKRIENLAYGNLTRTFNMNKRKMLGDFQNHSVTQEIDAGENAQNITRTLHGVKNANLFSFIGFYQGSTPTADVFDKLNDETQLIPHAISRNMVGNLLKLVFRYKVPDLNGFDKDTRFKYPDNWQGGSWIRGLEEGIDGLAYYMRGVWVAFSRSTVAVQTHGAPLPGRTIDVSKPIKYVTEIVNKFIARMS